MLHRRQAVAVRHGRYYAPLGEAFFLPYWWHHSGMRNLFLVLLLLGLAAPAAAQYKGQIFGGADVTFDGETLLVKPDSAFSLGMIADFARTLKEEAAWAYRRLFWESGLIGQVLYLEAEAAGIQTTGMGCYFDDLLHLGLGLDLDEDDWQSLYHFTVGGAVEDTRLTTLPAYFHLPTERVVQLKS